MQAICARKHVSLEKEMLTFALALCLFFVSLLSLRFVQPPVISFEAIFEQSSPNSPIVFILSPGSEPANDLMKLAKRTGFGANRLKFLAMGQGQEKVHKRIFPSP